MVALLDMLVVPAEELALRGGAERFLRRRKVRHLELNEVDFSRLEEEALAEEEEEILDLGEAVIEAVDLAPPEAPPAVDPGDEAMRLLRELEGERDEGGYLEKLRPLVAVMRQRSAAGEFRVHLPVMGALVRHANDRNRPTGARRSALEGLRAIGDRKGVQHLLGLLLGEKSPPLDALAGIFTALWEGTGEALIEALARAQKPNVRRRILYVLKSLGDLIVPTLVQRLKDDRWFVARNAASVLGEIGRPKAVDPLGIALGHADGRVRREAVRALSRIGGERALTYLVGALGGKDLKTEEQIILALGHARERKAVPPLIEILRRRAGAKNEGVLREAVRALGRIGGAEGAEGLSRLLLKRPLFSTRRKGRLRQEAATALGESGARTAGEALHEGLRLRRPELVESSWGGLARLDELLS